MMLRPSMTDLATRGESYYSVVVGIAKRAKEITDEMLEKSKQEQKDTGKMVETRADSDKDKYIKPVRAAVDEYDSKKFRIVEDPSLKTGA